MFTMELRRQVFSPNELNTSGNFSFERFVANKHIPMCLEMCLPQTHRGDLDINNVFNNLFTLLKKVMCLKNTFFKG